MDVPPISPSLSPSFISSHLLFPSLPPFPHVPLLTSSSLRSPPHFPLLMFLSSLPLLTFPSLPPSPHVPLPPSLSSLPPPHIPLPPSLSSLPPPHVPLLTFPESCNPHPLDPYCDSCVPCAVTLTLFTGLVQFLLGIFSLGQSWEAAVKPLPLMAAYGPLFRGILEHLPLLCY